MGTKYSITDHAVARHATNLDTTVASMNQNLSQFITSLEHLPNVWKGAAFTSFHQVQERWQTATRDLNQAMQQIQGRVGNSAQIYDAGHEQQTADLNSLNASANWDSARFSG